MKICITSEGKTLDSKVDQRFGRCRYFMLIDTTTSEFEIIENTHIQFASGAGIQSGQLMASKGVESSFNRKYWTKRLSDTCCPWNQNIYRGIRYCKRSLGKL